MRILGIERDSLALNFYRVYQPLMKLQQHGLADVVLLQEDSRLDSDHAFNTLMGADMVVVHRPSSEEWYRFTKLCRKLGKIVVADYDDDPFNTSPWNPFYQHIGTEEVHFRHEDGTVEPVWTEDMKGAGTSDKFFNIEENIRRRDMFQLNFSKADMVTCTTPILKDTFLKLNKNVDVLPNLIDPNAYITPEMVKKEVRIGWQGGISHYEDLWIIKDAVAEVLHANKNVKFVYFGDTRFVPLFKDCPPDQFEHAGWIKHNAYPFKLALLNLDIGLCPVVDNKFNRNKSAIKWMEYSTVGATTIASNLDPYKSVMDKKTGLLVENTKEAWVDAMNSLIKSKAKRKKIAKSALECVNENHNADKFAHLWMESYAKILKGTLDTVPV